MMRGRIVLFIVLAVATALAAAYLGLSAGAPKAAGKPPAAATASSPAGSTPNRAPGPGPARSPAAPAPQAGQKMSSPAASPPKAPKPKAPKPKAPKPKAPKPKAPKPKAPKPKAPKPKACSSTAAAQPPAFTTLSDPPPPSATGPVHFGQVSATSSQSSPPLDISPDYRALTMNFSKIEITTWKGSECDVTRSLSMTLPVTGTARAGTLDFGVSGFAVADQGASAQLTVRGNGQVKVQRFPAGFEHSYVVKLEFPVTPGATYTLSVQLEVHQNPGTGGAVYLNTSAIDSQVT
jgi:hypothetical protein